jgi:hypothetical protein
MRLPGFIGRVVKRLSEKRQSRAEDQENYNLVQEWKSQFEIDRRAKSEWDTRFVEWEGIYNGDREFKNLGFYGKSAQRDMRTNINFPRMIVERLIDPNVPQPDFKPVSLDDEEAVEDLKNYVDYVVRAAEPSLEEINLQDERRVKKFGGTFRKVHWNNNVKRAGYAGDIELSNPHPKDILPNKGATSIRDMEHYHHCVNHTGREIVRKWPWLTLNDLEDKATYIDDLDTLDSEFTPTTTGDSHTGNEARDSGLKKYTVIETTYRDEDGDICKLWWSGDLFIKHVPKFYWRRDENGSPTKTEILEAGTQIRRAFSDGTNELITLEQDTEVEYYIPTRWDIIYEPYIPRDKCFWGVSLMEDIHDLNEAIKKAIFQAEERRLRGNKKILVDNEEDARRIQDPASEVIALKGAYHGMVDLGAKDDILWIEKLKEWLQLLTGATNAAMGVEMPSVTSGEQAKVYVEQAQKKIFNSSAYKSTSYKQLYKVIADFALAFADGDRPFRLSGDKEQAEYGTFNRLNILKDQNGNIFYPNYDVEIGSDGGFLQQKGEIMNAILQLADGGKFDATPGNLRVLKILKRIGVPYLDEIIEGIEQDIEAQSMVPSQQAQPQSPIVPQLPQPSMGMPQAQGAQSPVPGQVPQAQGVPPDIMQVMQGFPPEVQQLISSLPPDAQAIFVQRLQASPEEAMAMLQQAMSAGVGG